MDGTIIGQGTFRSLGTNTGANTIGEASSITIQIPSGADWMRVLNYSAAGSTGTSAAVFQAVGNAFVGTEFYWQRGMAPGTGTVKYYANATSVMNGDTLVSGGFTLYDPSGQTAGAQPLLGPAVATTATTNATQPVVSTGSTAGISVGTVVRLSNTAQTDINGFDFVVGAVTANVSFTLLGATNVLATAPGVVGGAGFYRIVNVDSLFYPRRRLITNITRAVNAVVSTSIAHGLTPGQKVRFNIPAVSGMTQLNANSFGVITDGSATILTVVDDFSFTIDVDTTTFTAFTYPTVVQQPSNFPELIPFGENTAASLVAVGNQTPSIAGQQIFNTNTGLLADSTVNTGFLGMILGPGGNGNALTTPILGPAGSIANVAGGQSPAVMYWLAGKSTYGGL